MQVPTAKGRYLVSHEHTFSTKLLSEVLSKRFPGFKFPAGVDTPSKHVLSNAKACTLPTTLSEAVTPCC